MCELPILFNGAMVRALLAGTKTQTRRIVQADFDYKPDGPLNGKWYIRRPDMVWNSYETLAELVAKFCPYGKVGDRLWVRETCRAEELTTDGSDGVRYVADNHFWHIDDTISAEAWLKLYGYAGRVGGTVPPIHMPRWASRLLLEIVAVRVERLHDISEADAVAEGIEPVLCPTYKTEPARKWKNYLGRSYAEGANLNYPVNSYETLWNSINGPESWAANPWVWVVEFKVLQKGGQPNG